MVRSVEWSRLSPTARIETARAIRASLALPAIRPGNASRQGYLLRATDSEVVSFYDGTARLDRADEKRLRAVARDSHLLLPMPARSFNALIAGGGFGIFAYGFASAVGIFFTGLQVPVQIQAFGMLALAVGGFGLLMLGLRGV